MSVLEDNNQPKGKNEAKLTFPSGVNKARWFFRDFIKIASDFIEDEEISFEMALSGVHSLFAKYETVIPGNLLWCYARVIIAYINSKRDSNSELRLQIEDSNFKDSIINSPFRKFGVV